LIPLLSGLAVYFLFEKLFPRKLEDKKKPETAIEIPIETLKPNSIKDIARNGFDLNLDVDTKLKLL
jgi:hypothetical protein